jgi:hypothetical protein
VVSGADHEELIEALHRCLLEAVLLDQAAGNYSDMDMLQALTFQEDDRAYVMFLLATEPGEAQSDKTLKQQNDKAGK